MSTENDYKEKRNFIRMFVNAKVRITDLSTGSQYDGEGKNLSGDGAMFATSHKFKVNQRLTIDICSEKSNLASLSAEFEVMRVQDISEGKYEIAGTMLDVK